MPDIKQVLNEEIRRLAKKEIKIALVPLAAVVAEQKRQIAELKKELKAIKSKAPEKMIFEQPAPDGKNGEEVKLRLNAAGIIKIRTKLKLTQGRFAALLGVSTHTVSFWELGKVVPRAKMKKAICALRSLGRRELKKRLAALENDSENN